MSCCYERNIVEFSGKCGDLFVIDVEHGKFDTSNGVPKNSGIGGGDYVTFSYCANCGKIQGGFPIKFEESEEDDE